MTNISNNAHLYQRAIGVLNSRSATEEALQALKNAGFDLNNVSVIARSSEESESVAGVEVQEKAIGNKADEAAVTGAAAGGALGGITGLLVGLGTLAIPGVGPVLLLGAEAAALATTLTGTAIGAAAGSLVGGLIGLGIPEDRAKVYDERVSHGHYLVIITGNDGSIRTAQSILQAHGIQEWSIYQIADLSTDTPVTVGENPNILIVDRPDETRNIF